MKNFTNIISVVKKATSFIVAALFIAALCFGIFKLNNKYLADKKEPEVMGEETSVFKETLEPIYAEPVRIVISSVGVDAEIEPVGVAEDGSLDTPKIWQNAGWYEKGSKSGEKGNLLINAHYDDNFGQPAAFWQLKNVNLDDKVTVVDTYGRRYEYNVIEYSLVSINDPNRMDTLKSDESAKITLITCGGVWIPGKATYDKRLVIKGELIR